MRLLSKCQVERYFILHIPVLSVRVDLLSELVHYEVKISFSYNLLNERVPPGELRPYSFWIFDVVVQHHI